MPAFRLRRASLAAPLAATFLLGCGCAAAGEVQIAGEVVQTLDGLAWSAVSSSGELVPAQVPGDLISDLARAGIISDPWKNLTWREQASLWDVLSWNYTVSFATPPWANRGATLLVFDSVKMAGDVILNGVPLGAATSQHLRYTYDISKRLQAPPPTAAGGGAAATPVNTLTVSFPPTVSDTRNDFGRYQGCSGGWDWAPYSNESTGRTPLGIRTMSKGLVKSVYLTHVKPACVFITAVKPLVVYLGSYPQVPLTDATAEGWRIDVVVYLQAPAGSTTAAKGTLQVTTAWGSKLSVQVSGLASGVETAINVSLAANAGAVRLWWPNTVSATRSLYDINVSFTPSGGGGFGGFDGRGGGGMAPAVTASSRVGFRTLALVTADDSDPSKLAGVLGSGTLTMRIKLNGADLSVRGANWIPLEELSARATDAAHVAAVASAAAAGMSILRIWGGGIYPCEAFLAAADAAGLLLYVDAMYASQADSHHFAADTAEQRAELVYNVRRMAPHPCVAIYDACNECGGSGAFQEFVAPGMAAEDPTRPIWPSSPSAGWADGVDRLWGTPLPGRSLRILEREPLRTTTPGLRGGCNCTEQAEVFYYGMPLKNVGAHPSPSDSDFDLLAPPPRLPGDVDAVAACCNVCEATPGCAIANYKASTQDCLLIAPPFAPTSRRNSVALFPPSSANLPMPIPAIAGAEQHGPYQGGGGWPTVNGGGPPAQPFGAQLPPELASPSTTVYGSGANGTFTSEFGVGQPASFELMAPTLSEAFWSMHGGNHAEDTCTQGHGEHVCTGGNVMAQRNYGCDDAFATYFPDGMRVTLGDVGAWSFAAQLYLCQLATTLVLQSMVEVHRSSNSWGLMTWQLGEVWPTYGWGSLEYSSGAGSVLGGRWKPSHYMLARAFANVAVACSASADCFVKNDDALHPIPAADVVFTAVRLGDGRAMVLGRASIALPRGANAVTWLCASGGGGGGGGGEGGGTTRTPPAACVGWKQLLPTAGCAASGIDCVIAATVTDAATGAVLASNMQLLAPPGKLNASRTVRVTAVVGETDPVDGSVPITVTAAGGGGAAPALFVTLFTAANGRFNDNFLTLLRGSRLLRFFPSVPDQRTILAHTLRVNTLGELLKPT